MTWPTNPRPAKSLIVLRDQINDLAPNRDKSSDGMLASSPHHVANPNSDHEAHIMDGNVAVVTALDITNDIAHGINSEEIAEALRAAKDARIKYLISNKKIAASYQTGGKPAWAWRPYTGTNPHNHHFHISVLGDKSHYDSTAPWKLELRPIADAPPSKTIRVLRMGDTGDDVKVLQAALNSKGFSLKEDGDFGPATEGAVKIFQTKSGLVGDGIAGRYTMELL
jgi:murein L,D-transpeptidase YcbB/YkuD